MEAETVKSELNNIFAQIQTLPESEQTDLLKYIIARASGAKPSARRKPAQQDFIDKLNAARRENGVSDETRAKLSQKSKAAWAKRKQQADAAD